MLSLIVTPSPIVTGRKKKRVIKLKRRRFKRYLPLAVQLMCAVGVIRETVNTAAVTAYSSPFMFWKKPARV